MKRRTAPKGRPTRTHMLTVLEDAHARATRLAEAHADCDHEFVALGLLDLAADLWRAVERARGRERACRCHACGLRFDWPGQLEQHVRVVHGMERAA